MDARPRRRDPGAATGIVVTLTPGLVPEMLATAAARARLRRWCDAGGLAQPEVASPPGGHPKHLDQRRRAFGATCGAGPAADAATRPGSRPPPCRDLALRVRRCRLLRADRHVIPKNRLGKGIDPAELDDWLAFTQERQAPTGEKRVGLVIGNAG
jgi:hypothetical protein